MLPPNAATMFASMLNGIIFFSLATQYLLLTQ